MAFYDLPKPERAELAARIRRELQHDLESGGEKYLFLYFADEDTYIRKAAYIATGRIYLAEKKLRAKILRQLEKFFSEEDFKIRQTLINAAGEIGKTDFEAVQHFFDKGLFDAHHVVRNAVIGSVKKMGQKNPEPVLRWAKKYLHHADKEIRREICHGIELRGRTHPQDILPLLKELQFDTTARVRNTLVHVLGQIAYKKGCLVTVIAELNRWENRALVNDALEEIIDVHHRYRDFSAMTQAEARAYIQKHFGK